MLFKSERIRQEFLGDRSISIRLDSTGNLTTVLFRAELRAMIVAADFETQRIYDVHLEVTDCLRTWEQQDAIYRERNDGYRAVYKEHGPGYHEAKFISPHMCGRGVDVVPKMGVETGEDRHRLNKIYSHVEDYFNTRFPYCWNAPWRLLEDGILTSGSFKTARDHTVKGRHIHVQLSWGSFIG